MKAYASPLAVVGLALAFMIAGQQLAHEPLHDRDAFGPRDAAALPTPAEPPKAPTFAPEDPELEELLRPTGAPRGLACDQARRVVREIQTRFAAELVRPTPAVFAELVVSWLDPHGLWSAASDAPTAALISAESARLLDELELRPDSDLACTASESVGVALAAWIGELTREFDAAADAAPKLSPESAAELALLSAFEDGDVTVPGRMLARELGRRVGATRNAFGAGLAPYTSASRERYLPALEPAAWASVVLAAAVRAYVAAADPHGAWVPLDEEWSLFAGDPSFGDDAQLWGDMLRTAVGVRVVDRPTPPLAIDDLVLAVDGLATAGLSVEQTEQLARAALPGGELGRHTLTVLRAGEHTPRDLLSVLEIAETTSDAGTQPAEIELELVPYGRGQAAVVHVPYVGDDLGERLADLVVALADESVPVVGMLLDLRGNGGGSTDGATDALGVFVPDAPAFPLLFRGRVMEVLVAPDPAASERFAGPVAVLVDGTTASAAEMLAGALQRYGRALLLGERTYGKGCVQEYFRDRTGAGALRLTTRQFVLPDGSAVQRTGLTPSLVFDFGESTDHESDLPGALAPVSGPDVRRNAQPGPAWPAHGGRLGPCRDSRVCRALGRVSGGPTAAFRQEANGRKRRAPR
jgi:carboxyl-terminal processing protease